MIQRLNENSTIDLIEFFNRVIDKHKNFFITENNTRKFFKGNWNLIKKILKTQEVYGIYEQECKGILIIYKEKGFRPYIKLLSETRSAEAALIKYLMLNFSEQDLYIKLKKTNPLAKYIGYFGFIPQGDRGQEVLMYRKGIKVLHKMVPKDILIEDTTERLY